MKNDNRSKRLWLFKSEPDEFGIDHLRESKNQTTQWSGIRNYQARNFIKNDMRVGDQGFFYHSSCAEPGAVGIVEVSSEPYPDPTQFDRKSDYYDPKSPREEPRWSAIDVRLVAALDRIVTLAEMREHKGLQDMRLLARGNRLSIIPVDRKHWDIILSLASKSL